jgi:hypothetical protein
MKYLAITIMLFSSISLFAQVRNFNEVPKDILKPLDKMGDDNSQLLNKFEGAYLNIIFKDSLNGYDFTGKKVGFIYSGAKSNKKEYFDLERNRFNRNNTPNGGVLYIFNTDQKAKSGGYDAAIVYWGKILMPVEKVVKRLKEK